MSSIVASARSHGPDAGGHSPRMPEQTLTFVGNATTVLRLGAFTVLTDPNFPMFEDFLRRVRPRRAVPVHDDDYGVIVSGLDDARAAARAAGFAERLEATPPGGTVSLAGPVGTPS
jgi:hypothetical protein